MATWWQRPAAKRARRCIGGTGLVVTVLAVCAAGCAGEKPIVYSNSVTRDVNSLGCYVGTFRLHISSTHARVGQSVTLAANGPRAPAAGVSTESWGLLGTDSGGHFAATYNLAAITAFDPHARNVPLGSALAGVGLPNRPFRVRVPPVPSGSYIIQFAYFVEPGAMGNAGRGEKAYTLCAPLHVGS
jgi:hypothetical protein